jgi:hypothetical protein
MRPQGDEPVLLSAPPYQAGPFGNFYLPNTTPLYGAGSCSPADAGLYHYTTRPDQVKEGDEPPPHNVNIGLHYIAATNLQPSTLNFQPIDTDGDGIPDYVENWHGDGAYTNRTDTETDWQNPMTDGVTNDIYNTIYDDVDLDGDGLTGRAERILGTNPTNSDNPLILTPVITGQEPYILTYSMPLSIGVDSNRCNLRLLDNGVTARGYCFTQLTNGSYQVRWNTTFSSYGPHVIQVQLSMPGATIPSNDIDDTQTINDVRGTPCFETVNSLAQFDPDTSLFIDRAWIYGTLQVQSADYEIDIYDTTNNLLTTITNHTDNGVIDEVWDLTTDTNTPARTDEEFNAKIYITPTSASSSQTQSAIHPNDANTPPASIPLPYHFLRTVHYGADTFTMAYGWSSGIWGVQRQQMIQNNVVNVLFNPGADNPYNNTYLNTFDGTCFSMGTTNDQELLLDDLSAGGVVNFFWDGHGNNNYIGARPGDKPEYLSSLPNGDVKGRLLNIADTTFDGWVKRKHPYRLVILNSCESAQDQLWANTFGIVGHTHTLEWFDRAGFDLQAFVGWPGDNIGPIYPPYFGYRGAHLHVLFDLWMQEVPLEDCLIAASTLSGQWELDMPLDSRWKIFGYPWLTRSLW